MKSTAVAVRDSSLIAALAQRFRPLRWWIAGVLTLLVGTLLVSHHAPPLDYAQAADYRPIRKIVLLTFDALRADKLGCYGYTAAPTSPTIDQWGEHAVVFDHAYSQGPWTVPSMGSLMSGRYGREVGAYTNLHGDIESRDATLAERLRGAGFHTAFFNTNPLLLRPGIERGFESVAPPSTGGKIPYARVEPLVMGWLDEHAGESFFLWIHDMDTHSPLTEGNPHIGEPGLSDNDAEVRNVDDALQHLLAKLHALGIDDEVLLIVTADHGEAFGDHHLDGHQDDLYDEVLRVPLFIKDPRVRRSGRVAAPVALLDLNPTIAELAGVPMGSKTRGESLVPFLGSKDALPTKPYVFSERYFFGIDHVDPESGKLLTERGTHELVVHDQDWALIARVHSTIVPPLVGSGLEGDTFEQPDWDTSDSTKTSYELYDLSSDPQQVHDVFGRHPFVAARLERALSAWKQLTDGGYQAANAAKETPKSIDPATQEELHALGYDGA